MGCWNTARSIYHGINASVAHETPQKTFVNVIVRHVGYIWSESIDQAFSEFRYDNV